jgi:hypothetical protein
MELKTLKDIEGEVGFECSCGKKWKSKDNAIFPKTLKQEAIKWVKIYQEKRNLTNQIHEKTFYYGKIEGIRNFFNLTDEDLK